MTSPMETALTLVVVKAVAISRISINLSIPSRSVRSKKL